MDIETTQITKLIIKNAPALDPIDVFLEDIEPHKGKITITCYGKSWTAYWGGMGDRSIAEFFLSCDEHYIAGNLSSMNSSLPDYERLYDKAKAEVCRMRRKSDLTRADARDLYGDLDHYVERECDIDGDLMHKVFGDEWWHAIPNKPNPDYQYLCRIITAVQEALKEKRPEKPDMKRLGEIGHLIRTQDNRITDAPIFIVQRLRLDWGYDSSYADDYKWIDTESGDGNEADPEDIERLEELDDACEDTAPWEKCYLKERWEYVTACFTEKGCEDYLRLNGHNLGKTRIYADGSYRNNEFRDVRSALMAMATHQAEDQKETA